MSIKLNNINNFAHLSTNEYERGQPSCETLPVYSFEFQKAITYESIPGEGFIFYICSIVSQAPTIYAWDIILSQSQYDEIYQCITNGDSAIEVPTYTEMEKSILIPNLRNFIRNDKLGRLYKHTIYSNTEALPCLHGIIIPNEGLQNRYQNCITRLNEQISHSNQ